MIKSLVGFYVVFALLLSIVFGAHIFILDYNGLELFENNIKQAYLLSYILSTVLYTVLYFFRVKHKDILGFIFLGGTFLKFAIFMALFFPLYREDDIITRVESSTVLVPYLSALFVLTFSLVKLMNSED